MLRNDLEASSYTVKLITGGGTVYTYDSVATAAPGDAGRIVCTSWEGRLSCPCADLRQTDEHQWESISPEGVLVQVRREAPAGTGSVKEARKHYRITFRYEDGTRATRYVRAFTEREFVKSDWERTPTGYRNAAGAGITVEDLGTRKATHPQRRGRGCPTRMPRLLFWVLICYGFVRVIKPFRRVNTGGSPQFTQGHGDLKPPPNEKE